ncbi:hypothetical protein [Nocardia sp. NPDC057353]|uniref:hypothetical protein n=1 Tax=Nocardia sp. NPDC057353 TaxID=3346104 RepID=UPI0036304BFB
MTDDTRPTSTDTGAGTFQEARFRADYMHSLACYPADPDRYDPADSLDAADYVAPWMDSADWHEQDWCAEWVYLGDARERWERDPAAAAAHAASGELTEVQRRSEAQARHLAEHGLTYGPHGLVTGPYIEAVEQRGYLARAEHDIYLYRYANLVENDEEVLMRADYDRVRDLYDPNTTVYAEYGGPFDAHAKAIEQNWSTGGGQMAQAWRHLDAARAQWQSYPAMSQLALTEHETAHARGESGRFTEMQWRNQLHARQLTGHGEWTVEAPTAAHDRDTERDQLPNSALADYRSGNALATGLANERKGLRR